MNEGSSPESPSALPAEAPHALPSTDLQQVSSSRLLSRIRSVEFTAYSGPIPPPDLLQRFDEVYPGAAQQILEDFVQESAHRRAMERKVVGAESFKEVFGSIFAGLIGLTGVGGGIWLAHEGRSTGGLSAIFATLASLVGVYLYQTRKAAAESAGNSGDPSREGTQR